METKYIPKYALKKFHEKAQREEELKNKDRRKINKSLTERLKGILMEKIDKGDLEAEGSLEEGNLGSTGYEVRANVHPICDDKYLLVDEEKIKKNLAQVFPDWIVDVWEMDTDRDYFGIDAILSYYQKK